MGRRAQANARTLNWAVRQVFKPVMTDLPPKGGIAMQPREPESTSHALIPTQPPDLPSAKALGKRKLVEDESEEEDNAAEDARLGPETSFTKSSIPAELKKCMSNSALLLTRAVKLMPRRLAATLSALFTIR